MSSDTGKISDGYHTFDELYEHRRALTVALTASWPGWSWRSTLHHPADDSIFDGYFIVGMMTPDGMISYHYKLEHWDDFVHVRELAWAPKWDGHTSADVPRRLMSLVGAR